MFNSIHLNNIGTLLNKRIFRKRIYSKTSTGSPFISGFTLPSASDIALHKSGQLVEKVRIKDTGPCFKAITSKNNRHGNHFI
jgi:hypothetical protein